MWETVTPELDRIGLLGRIDLGALAAYCECWATWKAAREVLAVEGVVRPGRDGGVVKHPATVVASQASAELRAWARELGLTPAARLRLPMPPVDDDLMTKMVFGEIPVPPRAARK